MKHPLDRLARPLSAALLLVLGLGLGLLGRAPAEAQQTRGYDYRVFRLDPQDYTDKADYQQLLQREGPRAVEAAFYEHVLDHLGQEGWELVTTERRNTNLLYLYLKRPR